MLLLPLFSNADESLCHSCNCSWFCTQRLFVAFLAKAGTELGISQTAIGGTFAIQLPANVLGIGFFMLLPVERTFMWLTKIVLPVSTVAIITLGFLGQYFINTKQANLFLVTVFVCRFFLGFPHGLMEATAQVMAMRSVDKESMTLAVGRTEVGRIAAYSIGPIIGGTLYQYGGFYLPCCFSGALYIGMLFGDVRSYNRTFIVTTQQRQRRPGQRPRWKQKQQQHQQQQHQHQHHVHLTGAQLCSKFQQLLQYTHQYS